MLFGSRTATFTHTLPFPPSTVLAYIQDPDNLIRCNPDVVSVTPVSPAPPSPPNEGENQSTYTVTAQLTTTLNLQTTYTATFHPLPSGIKGTAHAGLGTVTESVFTVSASPKPHSPATEHSADQAEAEAEAEGEGETTVLTEEFCVTAVRVFLPFIMRTVEATHSVTAEGVLAGLQRQRGEAAT